MKHKLSNYDFELPEKLIAQKPTQRRGQSRLLVVNREKQTLTHDTFNNLKDHLKNHPLMVFNDTRVIPAKLLAQLDSNARQVEILLIRETEPEVWEVMMKGLNRLKPGTRLKFGNKGLSAQFIRRQDTRALIQFSSSEELTAHLMEKGRMPLPPYIHRPLDTNSQVLELDKKRYQTVFASHAGAIAAPTAGLHFTQSQLASLREKTVGTAHLTLHVGPGTFVPIRKENFIDHEMQEEYFQVSPGNWNKIAQAKKNGQAVLAVGTTSTRVLETQEFDKYIQKTISGWCNCFIYPGWEFRNIDHLLTNFHLPKSTLFLLVCAFMGEKLAKTAYREAIRKKYRFFSYGDAMLIL
ncbi:MAG: tRNA preQ1(34) S-adenosylmethionine ribosyltransferase-isomerase QueA [Nitrospinae bacterium]|nr:tRNA preQ1(34) S-adenosylmethionine ribosyltransferase-isomerase QueA [Nitrospinota bacterium]MBL7021346.1 tRNA preQ1(34) S-adenosylmethionine ribosyltransferase-isomerase QueA [Nitrospinaceae bacterium]